MNKIKLIGQHVGPKRIVNLCEVERKTFLGRDVIEVEFDDKSKKEYSIETLEVITTKERGDLTSLRILEITPVAEKVLAVLVDSELPIFDPAGANIQYLLQTVLPEHIQEKTQKGYGKLFGKDYHSITLFDMAKVFSKKDGRQTKDKKEDGTSS